MYVGDEWRSDSRTLLKYILQLSLGKLQQYLEGVRLCLLQNAKRGVKEMRCGGERERERGREGETERGDDMREVETLISRLKRNLLDSI